MKLRLGDYIQLAKPGIIMGNDIPAVAAFFLAARGQAISFGGLAAMLIGLSLVIASACITNNYLDRGIDAKMARTRKRATATGRVSARQVGVLAAVPLVLGTFVLLLANLLAAVLGLAGWFLYVVVYGVGKRQSEYGTLIGSLSGAVPPLVGYAAAAGRLDGAALVLFVILVLWQMPHFYAIAIYRAGEYQAAELPVWPLRRGVGDTKNQILGYATAFTLAVLALWALGYTGWLYLVVAAGLAGRWLWLGWQGRTAPSDEAWARRVFGWSLVTMTGLCAAIVVDSLLRGRLY
jgi:protoheme IX farnesyltransferase